MLFLAVGLFSLLIAGALVYQHAGARRDAVRCPPPGRIVRVDGLGLHVHALGPPAGAPRRESPAVPPVVFLSGIATSSLNWSGLQRLVASRTRAVAYDRPGLGWSDLGPRGLTAAAHARQLHALLQAAGVTTPVVLVAHSFGGFIAVLFALAHPGEVTGLVLVDPVTWQEWADPGAEQRYTLRGGGVVSRVGALLAALGVVRYCVTRFRGGSERVGRAVLGSFGGRAVAAVSRVMGEVGKMPADTWDAIQAHWSRPRAFVAMARHFGALPASAREVRDALRGRARPFGVPLVVLCAATASAVQREWLGCLARTSTRGRLEVVPGAGHWIHLDRPDVVSDAVFEILEGYRTTASAEASTADEAAATPS
jgi:pimeloyl-ACP methyl ester carboxylesterase